MPIWHTEKVPLVCFELALVVHICSKQVHLSVLFSDSCNRMYSCPAAHFSSVLTLCRLLDVSIHRDLECGIRDFPPYINAKNEVICSFIYMSFRKKLC